MDYGENVGSSIDLATKNPLAVFSVRNTDICRESQPKSSLFGSKYFDNFFQIHFALMDPFMDDPSMLNIRGVFLP